MKTRVIPIKNEYAALVRFEENPFKVIDVKIAPDLKPEDISYQCHAVIPIGKTITSTSIILKYIDKVKIKGSLLMDYIKVGLKQINGRKYPGETPNTGILITKEKPTEQSESLALHP